MKHSKKHQLLKKALEHKKGNKFSDKEESESPRKAEKELDKESSEIRKDKRE